MSEKMIENNKVSVIGEVVSEFTFSHEVFGEGFYIADLAVSRLSDQVDDSTHDFRTASGCIERLPRNDDGGDRPVPFLQPS